MKRNSIKSVFGKPSVYRWKAWCGAMVFAGLMSGPVFAQGVPNTCAANLNVAFDSAGPFLVGESIPIRLTLGLDYSQNASYVNINHFQYLLDCSSDPTKDMADCIADGGQGNVVSFDASSVWTDCKDAEGNDPTAVVGLHDGVVTVDFTAETPLGGSPSAGQATAIQIPNPAIFGAPTETCDVTFDVTVDSLDAANTMRKVVELTGWGAADAICDNEAEPTTVEESLEITLDNPNTVFWVRKDFSDNNPAEVDVHIRCDSGLPIQNSFAITDPVTGGTFPKVGFVVYALPSNGINCDIWEGPVPTGYEESYAADALPGAIYSDLGKTDDGCYYEGVMGGEFTCDITNEILPTTVIMNKVWTGDALDHGVELSAKVRWSCYNVLTEAYGRPTTVRGHNRFNGPTDSFDITGIYPSYLGDSYCEVRELRTASNVESDISECDPLRVPFNASEPPSCTIYNTIFFEGIPTLSQYGMAVLALLMLGAGLVGFRRFS